MQYAFRDRKNKKRAFRSLWIARIGAGSKEFGVSYSKLIHSLSEKNIVLDRKILADLAVNDSPTFKKVVEYSIS